MSKTKTTMTRAEFWLEVTEDEPSLGISDDQIAELTYDPDNLFRVNHPIFIHR